ncbi:MAG: LacI family DNA-binding transcriptional regulator [Clostridia bacterium]|nr:LacI family DNA-binding transcriptional regulator [Clostridia bacterium]
MSVTLRELAEYCGLSMSAVSKALNGYSDISDATRAAVLRAAKELDYHPNAHARALKSGCSYNLGVLFSDDSLSGLTHPFFSVVLEYFKREAERRGYDITFIGHGMGSGRLTYLDHCHYREVDGVCVACIDFHLPEIRELVNSPIPVVTIDHSFDGIPCVFSDNRSGMAQLMEYVYSMGHRRVAYLHGTESAVTEIRLQAYREMAGKLGFIQRPEYMVGCKYTQPDTAYEAAWTLLRLPERPTCMLVCDDYSAAGVLRAVSEAGLRVPEDISLAGFDGIEQMQLFHPRLTTVYQDAPRIGQEAAGQLISLVEGSETVSLSSIPCRLITGETVGPAAD